MKKTLITGASGFLGRIFIENLKDIYNLCPLNRDDFNFLTSNELRLKDSPDVVIHCAGLAHFYPKNINQANLFFEVNFEGLIRFLNCLENENYIPKSFIFISSVSVYGLEKGILIDENEKLNATEPYGKSKILAEAYISKWCLKHNVICSILRLPLIVGSQPKGNLKSMIKAIKYRYYFNIDGGKARKSMVMGKDLCKLIPMLEDTGGIYNLTDRVHPSFDELSKNISIKLGKNHIFNLSSKLVFSLALLGDLIGSVFPINSSILNKMTSELTFDDSKAVEYLNWNPTSVLDNLKV